MNQAVIRQKVLGMVGTNCYICMHAESKEAFIVDPADNVAAITRMVSDMWAKPCAVLLPHGHFDHILGVDSFKNEFGVDTYISKDDLSQVNLAPQMLQMFAGLMPVEIKGINK